MVHCVVVMVVVNLCVLGVRCQHIPDAEMV